MSVWLMSHTQQDPVMVAVLGWDLPSYIGMGKHGERRGGNENRKNAWLPVNAPAMYAEVLQWWVT